MKCTLITSPWRSKFENLISGATTELLFTSPYYNRTVIHAILEKSKQGVTKKFLFALSEQDVKAGTQSVGAIRMLIKAPQCEVRFIRKPKLHAKFIVADRCVASVTSSNLTSKGLDSNFEMGIWFDNREMAEELGRQFDHLWTHGKNIAMETLNQYMKFERLTGRPQAGGAFGGSVPLGKTLKNPTAEKVGWILIHSEKHFAENTPQDELLERLRQGEDPIWWNWARGGRGPMKKDGRQYTFLLAFKGVVFGEAQAKIENTKKSNRKGHPFVFMLSNYKRHREIPLDAILPEHIARKHRDMVKLGSEILDRYRKLTG